MIRKMHLRLLAAAFLQVTSGLSEQIRMAVLVLCEVFPARASLTVEQQVKLVLSNFRR
jgi:hypothetical protein